MPSFTQGLSGGLRIMLAGQNISQYVAESSILIKTVLGQGAGSGTGTGRSATIEFLAYLGPLYTAQGAGTPPTRPTLVRMGEIQVFDVNNNLLFGGYAAKFVDKTGLTAQSTCVKVEGYDYWQHLDRINTNIVVDGLTDLQVIQQAQQKYAPWLTLSLPTTSNYLFSADNYRNLSMQKLLQKVANITGFQIWVTPDKVLHYSVPTNAPLSPFSLSDHPNFSTSYQFLVTDVQTDDTASVNRVFFYGGKIPSNDYTQDLSVFANGTNDTFPLAYYPRQSTDGKIHVKLNNGPDLVLGSATGTVNAKNKLKKNGGICDVLINYDAHTLIFNVPPPTGSKVTCKYRYELPQVTTLADYSSYQYYGMWLDSAVSDKAVVDRQEAIQRSRVILNEESRGLRTLKFTCWKPGLQVGQLIQIDHTVRNIHDRLVLQEIDIVPRGGGNYEYQCTAGSWNWNLVDAIKQSAQYAAPRDVTTGDSGTDIDAEECYDILGVADTVTHTTQTMGQFYARSTPSHDGHDAYPGFSSVSS